MPDIDKKVFADNLLLTQQYCDLQVQKGDKDNATIFRSCNPLYRGEKLFSFRTEPFEIRSRIYNCTFTTWAVDPFDEPTVVDKLFVAQLNYKRQTLGNCHSTPENGYQGKIMVSQIDFSVIDGASEVQSLGLIDGFDLPPVDSWFYLTATKESRLLFAWIPAGYVHLATDAIEVNCVDCINWFEKLYPGESSLISI